MTNTALQAIRTFRPKTSLRLAYQPSHCKKSLQKCVDLRLFGNVTSPPNNPRLSGLLNRIKKMRRFAVRVTRLMFASLSILVAVVIFATAGCKSQQFLDSRPIKCETQVKVDKLYTHGVDKESIYVVKVMT